jgi:hypothetical protein
MNLNFRLKTRKEKIKFVKSVRKRVSKLNRRELIGFKKVRELQAIKARFLLAFRIGFILNFEPSSAPFI